MSPLWISSGRRHFSLAFRGSAGIVNSGRNGLSILDIEDKVVHELKSQINMLTFHIKRPFALDGVGNLTQHRNTLQHPISMQWRFKQLQQNLRIDALVALRVHMSREGLDWQKNNIFGALLGEEQDVHLRMQLAHLAFWRMFGQFARVSASLELKIKMWNALVRLVLL